MQEPGVSRVVSVRFQATEAAPRRVARCATAIGTPVATRMAVKVAFLATQGLSEADLAKSIQALERAGIHAEVVTAAPPANGANGASPASNQPAVRVSPASYCAVAIPALPEQAGALADNPTVCEFVQSMQVAGKPVLYVPVPGAASAAPAGSQSLARSLQHLWEASWRNWNAIDAPRLGAALAYYTLLSLAPLLVLMVSIAGVFFRRTLIQSGLMWQVENLMGNVGASIVRPLLDSSHAATGIIAGILSLLTLLVGASGVFLELRNSLDTVWGVRPQYGSGLMSLVRERLFAFLMVLGAGLVLSVSLLLTAILATPVGLLMRYVPSSGLLAGIFSAVISLAAMAFVFALIYKVVPDAYIRWSDVWIGALATSVLFAAGKWVIALYLSHAGIGSPYAAAGSLIVFLTWVYYSVQIFLLGAEFTHEYALRHGSYSAPEKRGGKLWRLARPVAR